MAKIPAQSSHTMWGKARHKKATRMYHTRNFGTGHVEADEYYLSRVGLRGRKRWIFLCAILLIFLIVIGHLLLTCVILGVLRFDSTGPPYFNFNDEGSLVWPQGARLSDVRLDGSIQAFSNHSLALTGQTSQQVILQSGNQRLSATENRLLNSSQVLFGPSEVRVHPFKSFAVTHADHQLLFVNSSLVIMNDLSSLSQLRADAGLRTSTVRAPLDSDLTVQSPTGSLSLRGVNGVTLGGRQANISSMANLSLLSQEGSIHIAGAEGIILQGLPSQTSSPSHHVCACSGTGRLFLVPSNPLRCAAAEDSDSICSS